MLALCGGVPLLDDMARIRLTATVGVLRLIGPLLFWCYSQEPGAQQLARRVSAVLNGNLRNVDGENTLHHDVDDLFEEMFDLAAKAGLLFYQSERNTGDSLYGSTGQCSKLVSRHA